MNSIIGGLNICVDNYNESVQKELIPYIDERKVITQKTDNKQRLVIGHNREYIEHILKKYINMYKIIKRSSSVEDTFNICLESMSDFIFEDGHYPSIKIGNENEGTPPLFFERRLFYILNSSQYRSTIGGKSLPDPNKWEHSREIILDVLSNIDDEDKYKVFKDNGNSFKFIRLDNIRNDIIRQKGREFQIKRITEIIRDGVEYKIIRGDSKSKNRVYIRIGGKDICVLK